MAGFGADCFEAELNDLAGCIQSLCTADLGAMATPSGVTPGTPLGCMFAWEDERLARTSKWRGETGSEKLLVARFARAVLALREVRDVTRIMELSATTGVFPPAPVTKSRVVVVLLRAVLRVVCRCCCGAVAVAGCWCYCCCEILLWCRGGGGLAPSQRERSYAPATRFCPGAFSFKSPLRSPFLLTLPLQSGGEGG